MNCPTCERKLKPSDALHGVTVTKDSTPLETGALTCVVCVRSEARKRMSDAQMAAGDAGSPHKFKWSVSVTSIPPQEETPTVEVKSVTPERDRIHWSIQRA